MELTFGASPELDEQGLGNIFNKVGQWFTKTFDKGEQRERDTEMDRQNQFRQNLIVKVGQFSASHTRQAQEAQKQCDLEVQALEIQLAELTKPQAQPTHGT
jgi:hypothetical protein